MQQQPADTARWAAWLALALAILAGTCSLWVVFEQDIYWQVRAGDELWQTHRFPEVDTWSYSAKGQPWLNIQWLSTLILCGIYKLGAEPALVWGRATLVALLMAMVGAIVLRATRGCRTLQRCAVLLAVQPLTYNALWPRLQLRSDTFVLLTFMVMMRLWQSDLPWRRQAALTCVCAWIATNLHAGTAPFVVLAGSAWILSTRPWREAVPWAVGCVISFFVTPYHGRVLPLLWAHVFYYEHNILRNSDQLPLDWSYIMPHGNSFAGVAWLVFLAATAAALTIAGWGRVSRKQLAQYAPLILCVLVFSAMCVNRVRAIPYQISLLLPWLATALAALSTWPTVVGASASWMMATLCVLSLRPLWGFGVHEHLFAVGSTRFVARERPAPNILHTFALGAYMVWYLRDYPMYVDTRETMYWDLQSEVLGAYYSPEITAALVKKYAVNTMLMPIPQTRYLPDKGFEDVITRYLPQHEWAIVYFDNISFVAVRRIPQHASLIAAHEFTVLRPNLPANVYPLSQVRTPERDSRFVSELARCLRNEPTNVYCQVAQATWWRLNEPTRAADGLALLEKAAAYAQRWTSPQQLTLWVELAAALKAAGRMNDAMAIEARLGEGQIIRGPTLPVASPHQ